MPFKFRDISGQKFGKLTALSVYGKSKNRLYLWRCVCECGKFSNIYVTNLTRGLTTSCGCYQAECLGKYSKKSYGTSSLNTLIRRYSKDAKKRNLEWSLTPNEISELISNNCHYCDVEPLQSIKNFHSNGDLIYNGIDRLDNDKGYIRENCVTCCKRCNWMKNAHSKKDFLAHIVRIVNNLKLV